MAAYQSRIGIRLEVDPDVPQAEAGHREQLRRSPVAWQRRCMQIQTDTVGGNAAGGSLRCPSRMA